MHRALRAVGFDRKARAPRVWTDPASRIRTTADRRGGRCKLSSTNPGRHHGEREARALIGCSSSRPCHQAQVHRVILIGRERSPAPSLHVSLVVVDRIVTKTSDERPLGLFESLTDLLL